MHSAGSLITDGDAASTLSRLTRPTAARDIPKLDPEQHKEITAIFTRLKSIYGHLWSSNFRSPEQLMLAQSEWIAAFRRNQVTRAEIHATLDWIADKRPNMPNLPEFIAHTREIRHRLKAAKRRDSGMLALPESEAQAEARKAEEAAERERYKAIGLSNVQAILQSLKTGGDV